MFLYIGSLILCWTLELSQANGPPYITEPRYNRRRIERVGNTIRLKCPVEAEPEPIKRWTKDGNDIHENSWERFKILDDLLRIKDASVQDSGIYLCTAVNGFGHEVINYTLLVLEVNATIPRHFLDGPSGDKSGIAPRFVDPTKMRMRNVQRPVGSTARLRCRAHGKPRPSIVWLKDGKPVAGGHMEQDSNRRPTWILKLRNLQVDDSGRYVCSVFNSAGRINFTYSLEVIGKTKLMPEFLPPHPLNITVKYGEKATFLCRVKSDVEPHMQWLKQLVDPDQLRKHANSTIDVNNQKFVVLKMSKVWASAESVFINKLAIDHVTEKHAGMYICLVTSQRGYSFRKAFLTVSAKPFENSDLNRLNRSHLGNNRDGSFDAFDDVHTYLVVYITVPVCVGALLVILIIICCLKNRTKPKSPQQHVYTQRAIDKECSVPLNQPQYSQTSKERLYRNLSLEGQPGYAPRIYRDLRSPHTYAEPVMYTDAHSEVSTRVHSDMPSDLSSVHTRDPLSDMYSEVSSIPAGHHNGLPISDIYCDGAGLPRVHHNPMDLHATLLARLQQQNRTNQRTPTPSESSSVCRAPHGMPHSTHYGMS